MLVQHNIFRYILWTVTLFFTPLLAAPANKPKNRLLAAPISGPWVLRPDGQLFKQAIQLHFYSPSPGRLSARRIIPPPYPAQKTAPAHDKTETANRNDMIWGLQLKNGEYLYGWIMLAASQRYRCKLWQRQKRVYLRIYNPPLYTTHQLQPNGM